MNTSNLSQQGATRGGHLKLRCSSRCRLLPVSGESGASFVKADDDLRCDDANDDDKDKFVVGGDDDDAFASS